MHRLHLKIWVYMRLISVLLVLCLTACSTNKFDSKIDSYFVWFTFVETIEQTTAKCKSYADFESKTLCGCWIERSGINYVVSIKRWDVTLHEMMHVVGYEHDENAAYCSKQKWFVGGF